MISEIWLHKKRETAYVVIGEGTINAPTEFILRHGTVDEDTKGITAWFSMKTGRVELGVNYAYNGNIYFPLDEVAIQSAGGPVPFNTNFVIYKALIASEKRYYPTITARPKDEFLDGRFVSWRKG